MSSTSCTPSISPRFTMSGRMRLMMSCIGAFSIYPVGVAHSGDLGRRHDERLVRARGGVAEARLDARGAVYKYEVEVGAQLRAELFHLLRGDGVLRLRLCCRYHVEVVEALVAYQRLIEAAVPLDDVDAQGPLSRRGCGVRRRRRRRRPCTRPMRGRRRGSRSSSSCRRRLCRRL